MYSDEVWTGVEYQVAAHPIAEGWVDESVTVVNAVRDRHDGIRRNPWNEVECGHHYARSMSSWLVLLALGGTQVNVAEGTLRFEPAPVLLSDSSEFKTFWSSGRAWGTFRQYRDSASTAWQHELQVLGGDAEDIKVFVGEQQVTALFEELTVLPKLVQVAISLQERTWV